MRPSVWRRTALVLAVGAIAASAVGLAVPGSAGAGAGSNQPPSGPISWVATGDSYSSGEGVAGNVGICAQSEQAYGPEAARRLRDDGWSIGPEALSACTGHLVEDLFNPNLRDSQDEASLWQRARDQGSPDRVDVVTFSFGGNDIGFVPVLDDCLPMPDSWEDYPLGDVGCDVSEDEIEGRIDALLDPPLGCSGAREDKRAEVLGRDDYDCDLLIELPATTASGGGVRGSMVDFYVRVAREHLTDRGHLVVVGYPSFFAPNDQWEQWWGDRCVGIRGQDAAMLRRQAAHLNETLRTAVAQANQELGGERVHYISRYERYDNGSHELCGDGVDWLNGITIHRDEESCVPFVTCRLEGSFHPNAAGHADTATALVDLVKGIDWLSSAGPGGGSGGGGTLDGGFFDDLPPVWVDPTVEQEGADPFDITVDFTGGIPEAGAVFARVTHSSLGCSGDLTLVSVDGATVVASQHLTGPCIESGTVTLVRTARDVIERRWEGECGDGPCFSTATLRPEGTPVVDDDDAGGGGGGGDSAFGPGWPTEADNPAAGFYLWMGASAVWPGTQVDGFPAWVDCSAAWCLTGTDGGSVLLIQIDPSPTEPFVVVAVIDPFAEPREALAETGLTDDEIDELLG